MISRPSLVSISYKMSISVDEAYDLIKKELIVSVELLVYNIVLWC